jgi:hypothetical protein
MASSMIWLVKPSSRTLNLGGVIFPPGRVYKELHN